MINVSNITKLMSGTPLYTNASFQIYEGEKVGLVGPNGAGKTTFFRLIIGEERPDEGAVSIQNNIRIAYFSQNVGEMKGKTALGEVIDGNKRVSELAARLKMYEEKLCDPELDPDAMQDVLDKMGDDQTEYEKIGGFDIENNAQTILTGLGIMPEDHSKPVEDFSSGWKMRIALAKVLIVMPDLILMDEPTNYLDMETILWLEAWLINFKGAILMTTHDRDFMNRVVKKIVEVANGKVTTYSGNYNFYEQERAIRMRNNEAEYNRQQSMMKKEEEFIARFKARASHAAQVQSRVKMLDKIEKVALIAEQDEIRIELPEIQRGGNDVAVIKALGKSWTKSDESEKPVFKGLNAFVHRQDRIAVVGVNGAGKSTFLRVLCGQTPPSSGEAIIGPSITIGYFGQSTLEELDKDKTIFEIVQAKLPQAKDGTIRNLLAAFLFKGDEVFKKIKFLSGGEKTRVILSYLLSIPYNCLVLDEPTNHLDIKSREVLLETLKRYEGTMLLVSHDRFFLREITNRVFEVDHGVINVYEGNYNYYLEQKMNG
ncbi:MAG TPA: ABC-F family ATP-binding cassette domain-containing protein [Chitinispirillaceae bacterium]|nr:ABC-F family ATP-binding cassette domain-containing protein [Chitinispirillaceae bacterium]